MNIQYPSENICSRRDKTVGTGLMPLVVLWEWKWEERQRQKQAGRDVDAGQC